MHIITILLILAALGLFAVTASALKKRKTRQKAIAAPFPASWVRIIEKNIPPYLELPEESRDRLYGYIQEFLYDKSFEGCGGLDLDDEIKITIAAQACLLLMNKDVRCYPKLRTILVYPSTYVAGKKGLFSNRAKDPSVRLGESWGTGLVVLAWDSVKQGAINFADGRNVTIHEFAHQLDQEDDAALDRDARGRAARRLHVRDRRLCTGGPRRGAQQRHRRRAGRARPGLLARR